MAGTNQFCKIYVVPSGGSFFAIIDFGDDVTHTMMIPSAKLEGVDLDLYQPLEVKIEWDDFEKSDERFD